MSTETSYKAAFVINARDKEKFVAQAVEGALSQTYPCHILLSDQFSKDATYDVMARTVDKYGPTHHKVELLHCPVEGKYSMRANNAHFDWLWRQTDAQWIFQCSADDYSLPERVRVCMIAAEKNECAIVACTVKFHDPANPGQEMYSGFPLKSGYVNAGEGLAGMAYGSTIHGFDREFLEKAGPAKDHTMDVYLGYLAALDKGYYVVCDPQHVHVMHASLDNMGFMGKLRAAEPGSDDEKRLDELNRFQLLDLYYDTALRAQELYPRAHDSDRGAIFNMIMNQTKGLIDARKRLHDAGITPGII